MGKTNNVLHSNFKSLNTLSQHIMQPFIVLLCRVEKQAGGGGRALMLVSGKKGSARHIRDGSWEGDYALHHFHLAVTLMCSTCPLHTCTTSLFTHSPCCHPSLGEHLHICTTSLLTLSPFSSSDNVRIQPLNCSSLTEHAVMLFGLLEKSPQSPIEHYRHLDLGNKYIFPAVQYTCTLACCGTRSISLESKGNKLSHFKLSQVSLIWLMIFLQSFWLYLQGKFAVNRRSYRFSPRWLMSRV